MHDGAVSKSWLAWLLCRKPHTCAWLRPSKRRPDSRLVWAALSQPCRCRRANRRPNAHHVIQWERGAKYASYRGRNMAHGPGRMGRRRRETPGTRHAIRRTAAHAVQTPRARRPQHSPLCLDHEQRRSPADRAGILAAPRLEVGAGGAAAGHRLSVNTATMHSSTIRCGSCQTLRRRAEWTVVASPPRQIRCCLCRRPDPDLRRTGRELGGQD